MSTIDLNKTKLKINWHLQYFIKHNFFISCQWLSKFCVTFFFPIYIHVNLYFGWHEVARREYMYSKIHGWAVLCSTLRASVPGLMFCHTVCRKIALTSLHQRVFFMHYCTMIEEEREKYKILYNFIAVGNFILKINWKLFSVDYNNITAEVYYSNKKIHNKNSNLLYILYKVAEYNCISCTIVIDIINYDKSFETLYNEPRYSSQYHTRLGIYYHPRIYLNMYM